MTSALKNKPLQKTQVEFDIKPETSSAVLEVSAELADVLRRSGLSPELQAHAAILAAAQAARRAALASFNAAALLFDYCEFSRFVGMRHYAMGRRGSVMLRKCE